MPQLTMAMLHPTSLNDDASCSCWRVHNCTQITKPRPHQCDRPGRIIGLTEIFLFFYNGDGHGEWSCDCKGEDGGSVRLDSRIHIGRIRRQDGESNGRQSRGRSRQAWAEAAPPLSSNVSVIIMMGVRKWIKWIKDGSALSSLSLSDGEQSCMNEDERWNIPKMRG